MAERSPSFGHALAGTELRMTINVEHSGTCFGIVVLPLDLHVVNVGSIPTGPTHGQRRLQSPPGDVLTSTSNVWESPRAGLNLEGRLSDPQMFLSAQ